MPHELNKLTNNDNIEYIVMWKGVFINSLRRVLEQVHPSLTAREDALQYVECFIIQLLRTLCSRPSPHTILDVEHRVRTTFPTPIDKWALEDAKEALEKFKKRSPLVLPIDKIHHLLQKEVLQYKIDLSVAVFIGAVLEYISADLLKLTGNYVKNIHHMEITCQDIRVAMCADKVLSDMFSHNSLETVSKNEKIPERSTYVGAVKDFIQDEKQHLRNLNMILKVFLYEIENVINIKQIWELQNMFQNLNDIVDFTITLVTSFEDILEMADDKHPPLVGSFLEELAEDNEFEIYARYTRDIRQNNSPHLLIDVLYENNALNILPSAGQGFKEAVKYYLPKLLHYPVYHCFTYFDYIKILQDLSTVQLDKDNLEQLEGLLKPLHLEMTKLIESLPKKDKEYGLRLHGKARQTIVTEKTEELLRTVDGFEVRYMKQCCTEFLREDILKVYTNSRRIVERRSILFDGMLVICKRKWTLPGPSSSNISSNDYKLKDVFYTRKIEIKDRDDTDEIKNSFEIIPREQFPVIFIAKNYEEKCNWISDLIMLNTRCMLDRSLNSVLENEEKKNPVQLPPVNLYRFAEPDSPSNIVFEDRSTSGGMMIKGATLLKLIERLTYHLYTDAFFVRTFLITYHTFTTSQEFLSLLIERFNIPDAYSALNIPNTNVNSFSSKEKEDIKRYKKQYYEPIRFRVMNVIKHWVDSYYDDFENSSDLLERLYEFLHSIEERSMRKWADCILNILQRKKDPDELSREAVYTHDHAPPPIEWHIMCPESEWTILTLHPVEFARQLTLIEYEMYKAVKSSELVGSVWTKENKDISSPNIIKIMKHTTNFTFWLEKTIVETANLEERIAVMSRMIEIMLVLLDLNNFNGVFAILSVMGSACVYRLKHTFQGCSSRLRNAVYETRELLVDHFKKYRDKLRSVTPPCVPFFGIFLTKILHIEEANKDFLPINKEAGVKLINFTKRRRVTEITVEIQQFQDKPYCLLVEPRIKKFIETLEPFVNMSEADMYNYLFQKSLDIEPRDSKQPPRYPRRWPDLPLKSPGIKIRNSHSLSKLQIPYNLPKILQNHEDETSFTNSNNNSNVNNSRDEDRITDGGNVMNNGNIIIPAGHDVLSVSQYERNHKDNISPASISNCKDFTIFTPIFFGPDFNSVLEQSHQNSLFMSPHRPVTEGPPLPPRMKRVSSQSPTLEEINSLLPPRDASAPPLPPRGDSLHPQHSGYVDASTLCEKNLLPASLHFSIHEMSKLGFDSEFCYPEENDSLNFINSNVTYPDAPADNMYFTSENQNKLLLVGGENQTTCYQQKTPTNEKPFNKYSQSSMLMNGGNSTNKYPQLNISFPATAVSVTTNVITTMADTTSEDNIAQASSLKSFVINKVVPSMFQFNLASSSSSSSVFSN